MVVDDRVLLGVAALDIKTTIYEKLDLIISIDTSVIHLAGAIGKPVWVPDWRWLRVKEDTSRYLTMRYKGWAEVVATVKENLAQTVDLAPKLSPGDVVVMDNLNSHHREEIREIIE